MAYIGGLKIEGGGFERNDQLSQLMGRPQRFVGRRPKACVWRAEVLNELSI